MIELKHTVDLENYIVTDLKSDEEIKLFLNASLKDYFKDGDFNSFYNALKIAIKAKDTVSGFAKKKLGCQEVIYTVYLKMKKNQNSQL